MSLLFVMYGAIVFCLVIFKILLRAELDVVEFVEVVFKVALVTLVFVELVWSPIGVNVIRMIIDPLLVSAGSVTVPDEMLGA